MLYLTQSSDSQSASTVYSFTDADGYGSFSQLNPGSFLLTSDHDGGVADAVVVEVSQKGPVNETVQLRWPSQTPVPVRSANGIVRGPGYDPLQTQAQLSLSLLEGVSARVIRTVLTDSKGDFHFPDEVPSGIYFLRLDPTDLRGWSGEQMQGMIPIEISPNAKQETIDLDIGWSSCGLTYAQREPRPEVKLRKICGDVVDVEGAAMSNARVLLFANGEGRAVEQTETGATGRFAFQETPKGTYQLLIKSPGFQPFIQAVRVEADSRAQGCQQPVHIRLKPML